MASELGDDVVVAKGVRVERRDVVHLAGFRAPEAPEAALDTTGHDAAHPSRVVPRLIDSALDG